MSFAKCLLNRTSCLRHRVWKVYEKAIRNRLSLFGVVRSSQLSLRGIFNGVRVFRMEISIPVPFFYLVRLKHKDVPFLPSSLEKQRRPFLYRVPLTTKIRLPPVVSTIELSGNQTKMSPYVLQCARTIVFRTFLPFLIFDPNWHFANAIAFASWQILAIFKMLTFFEY